MKVVDEAISRWINKLFGGLIEPVTPESINISAREGRAQLENLTIRPSCMAELGLPVVLNAGTVGSLQIDIPMRSLRAKPVRVAIRDVLISLSPNPSTNVKKAQLEKHLLERRQAQLDTDAELDPNSKLGRIFAKVADNFILTVENVHFRFEDTLSRQPSWGVETHPERCFSLGVTLDKFELRGVVLGADGEWEPRCIKDQQRFMNKTAVIGSATSRTADERGERALRLTHPCGLGIYLQHGERPLRSDDMRKWKADMRGYIAAADDPTDNHWVFGPISVACKVSVDTEAARRKSSSSRIWSTQQLPVIARTSWMHEELTKSNVVAVAVRVTSEQILAAGKHQTLRVCWAFETEKDATAFEVLHFADPAGSEYRSVQDATVVECQHERARGSSVAESGVLLLRWTNVGAKRRASSVRYTVWMESKNNTGEREAEPLPCSTMTAPELNEFLEHTGAPKPTVSRNSTKDTSGADLDERGWAGKDDGAQTELDVHTGRVQVNLHHRTLLNLIAMQNWYFNVERWRQISSLRPTLDDGTGTSALEAPRAWWQFAINAVVEFLPSHIFKTKLRMYIDGALEYDALFKRKYSNAEYAAGRGEGRPWHQPLHEHEHARVEELEEILPLEMVLNRREAMWLDLRDDEKHDEVRRRDVDEAEASLLAIAAQEWTARPEGDRVVQSNWAHFEGGKGKLKRHWFVLVDVMSQQPTRFSGWLDMRELLPETDEASLPKRMWFRLKGAALSWYTDTGEKTMPAGMIGISVIEEARQIPGSADTFELVIGSAGRRIQFSCGTFKELKQWLGAMDGALSHMPVQEKGDRWLLVYNKPTDSKAVEALPLKQRFYTLNAPRKTKKGLKHSYELSIALAANSSVRKCVVGCTTEDEEGFLGLMAHLESDVAETILDTPERAVRRVDNAQNADGDADDDDDDDDDVDDIELDSRTAEGRSSLSLSGAQQGGQSSSRLLQKIVLHVEQFSVSFGVRDSSWLSVDFKQLGLSTSLWEQGTTSLAITVQEVQIEDLYTRDSSHPQLLCRLAGDALGCEDDPMFRFLCKTRQPEVTERAPAATSSTTVVSPETSATTSSAARVGSVDDLKFDFSPEPEGQLETYIQAVIQPTQLVLNAHIFPVMASFFALRGNDGFKKVGAKVSASVTRLFSRFEQMTRPDMNSSHKTLSAEADPRLRVQSNNPLTSMRVLLKLKGFELILADDLSIMRDDASAVVFRMESFQVAHADYRTPRSAVGAVGVPNAEAGWSHRMDISEMDGIIPLEGHARNIEVFCCDRDNYSRNRQVILQPVTANISLRISSTGRCEYAEWLNLHVAVDTLDFHFSTQALMTLFKVLLSSSRLLELKYIAKALMKSKAIDATVDGLHDAAHSAAASPASGSGSLVDACDDDEAAASRVVAKSELSGSAIVRARVAVQKMLFTVELGGDVKGDSGDSARARHLQLEVGDLMVGMGLTPTEVVTRYQARHLNVFSTSAGKQYSAAAASGPATESGEAAKGQSFTADFPFGLCRIIPTLAAGDEATETHTYDAGFAGASLGDSRWLYNTADPNKLVRFTTVADLLQVTSPLSGLEEIKQLFPLLTVAMRIATLKAGLTSLAGGAAPAATLASTVWSSMEQLQQQLHQQGHLDADGTKGSAALSQILGADLAEVGINVAKDLLGDELWRSVVPTMRFVADYADNATTVANEKIQSRFGSEASNAPAAAAALQQAQEGALKELIHAEYTQAVTTSRSSNSLTIQFGAGTRAPEAASAQPAAATAVEAADFSCLGAAELELLCSSLGAVGAGGERSKDELLLLLKAKLMEGH